MNNILKNLKDNWVVLLFIGSLIVGWTSFDNRLNQVEAQTEDNKNALVQIQEIKQDIAVIKVTVEFIKDKIE